MSALKPEIVTNPLTMPLAELRGVGPERAAQLARLELRTVGDLLLHPPRRYEDRRRACEIAALTLEEPAAVRGQIVALGVKRYARGFKSVFEFILDDGTARLHCRWWNLPYMENYFAQGNEVLVYGKINSLRPRTMDHPETEVIESGAENSIHLNRIAPIYPLTDGLPQRWLRALVWNTLDQFGGTIEERWPAVPLADFASRRDAVRMLHFPAELGDSEKARQRLALDEFIELQLSIQGRRRKLQAKAQGWPCAGDNRLIKPFLSQLGFQLTNAQTMVLRELRKDLGGAQPMRRLLQGDVGSGKTVVAACCALMALESGFNVALMAPTEILADQHFQNFQRWLEPLGLTVELLTGSHKPAKLDDQADLQRATLNAQPSLVIGTHALIEESFSPDKLGLVIIDEQHKFGVAQRETLVRKGHFPHLLVMTATPIPRTLGLTLYGDLDISIIDELPPGRGSVKTFVRTADRLPKVWKFIREKLAEGRQAYVVYPRVEDGGKNGLKAVTLEWAVLKKELEPYQVGLLHGRLRVEEKESVMAAFRTGDLDVLLATPLIEVGMDIPNATIMLVENAEQFGLAQLHQLRGRIGRGGHESFCILVSSRKTKEAEQRLQILAETTDGFRIAEADLKLRGPGDLIGQQQSGLPPMIFADLTNDGDLVERARTIAATLLETAPRSGLSKS
jgi:ATP-dependent DNA helicase RecG